MLELAPETEILVRENAARDGVDPDAYIKRLLSNAMRRPPALLTEQDVSDAEKRASVLAYITLPKEEIARRNKPSIALLRAQLADAQNATAEEIAAADAEWETHKHSMNETRRSNGERLVYAEPTRQ